jgi:hypothetical protein
VCCSDLDLSFFLKFVSNLCAVHQQAAEKSQNGQIHTTTNDQEKSAEDTKKAERHEKEGEKKEVHVSFVTLCLVRFGFES